MTMTFNNKIKQTMTIMAMVTALMITGVSFAQDSYACALNNNCYGVEQKATPTYGNKFTVSVPNIDGTGTSGTKFGVIDNWIVFPNGDWMETGAFQGYLDGSGFKSDEWMMAANLFHNGTPQEIWQSHWLADINTGTTYTFEYEDDDGDYIWDARLSGVSKIQKIVSWSRGTGAMTGAEIDDNAIIIPKTQLNSIQLHSGTSWSNWASANGGFGTIPSSTTEIYIKNHSTNPYQKICVATSSIATCP